MKEQEQLIIKYICLGLSNQKIGERIFLDAPTVKKYVKQIFAKYNVHNRVELTIKLLKSNIISEQDLFN